MKIMSAKLVIFHEKSGIDAKKIAKDTTMLIIRCIFADKIGKKISK